MPRLTLSRKIFLALATLLIAMLLIFTGLSVFGLQAGLGSYAAEIEIRRMDWLAQLLQKHHAAHGDWKTLKEDGRAWQRLRLGGFGFGEGDPFADLGSAAASNGHAVRLLPPWYMGHRRTEDEGGDRDGPPGRAPPFFPLSPFFGGINPREEVDSIYRRLGVVDASGALVAGTAPAEGAARLPLRQGNNTIGYLVLAPLEGMGDEAGRAFLARQSRFLVFIGLAGLVLALVLSWFLARRWFAPIDDLAEGAQNIAAGRLAARVPVRGSDELAVLGRTFNSMAERFDTIEASRRAWLTDVAHELRTPLAAMRAEIEALQDGVRSFDDRTALRLHRQVMRLGQLVDDLRSSMREAEATPAALAPAFPLALLVEALSATRDRFAQRAISVEWQAVDALAAQGQPTVHGDARRLYQVFVNLLENTLSYTDPGGSLQLGVHTEGAGRAQRLVLHFDDSAPGVRADELPRLFERLFRGESSRNRELGGSGLGLSICRAIVEAHGGTIGAAVSSRGGLCITVVLPLGAAA